MPNPASVAGLIEVASLLAVVGTHADGDAAVGSMDAPDSVAAAAPDAAEQEPETPAARAHKVSIRVSCCQHCCAVYTAGHGLSCSGSFPPLYEDVHVYVCVIARASVQGTAL
jgi:hypothetical protein